MASARKIRISREGVYYLFVTLFVILGAVLREVSLLVVLAGMLLGPLIFNWRLVSIGLRGWEARRRLPGHAVAGVPFQVELEGRHSRRRLGSWATVLEDAIERQGGAGRGERLQVEAVMGRVAAGETGHAIYTCRLTRRGRYRFGPLVVRSGWPLGLVTGQLTLPRRDTLTVYPALGKLTSHWSRLIDSDRMGDQRSQRRRGLLEGDYYGLREWRPGDSRSWIHWRTSAKLGRLAVLQFEQQRSREIALVLDLWQPARATRDQQALVELAASFAGTAVVDICRRGSTRLDLSLNAHSQTYLTTPQVSPLFAHEALRVLAELQASADPPLAQAMQSVQRTIPSTAHLIVISTRAEQSEVLAAIDQGNGRPRFSRRLWIDVSNDAQLQKYFHWRQLAAGLEGHSGADEPDAWTPLTAELAAAAPPGPAAERPVLQGEGGPAA